MDKVSLSEFRDAYKHQQELYEQYKEAVKPYEDIYRKFDDQVENWFEDLCKTDPTLKGIFRDNCNNPSAETDITDETVTFKIGMWDYESVYIQYFICKVPLSDIPKLLDNKKSIWKYNPDTDVHYF